MQSQAEQLQELANASQAIGKMTRAHDRMVKKTNTAINSGSQDISLSADTGAAAAKIVWGDATSIIRANNTPSGTRVINVSNTNVSGDAQVETCLGVLAPGAQVFNYGIQVTRIQVSTSSGAPNSKITLADVDPFTGNIIYTRINLLPSNSNSVQYAEFPAGLYVSEKAAFIIDVPAAQDVKVVLTKDATYADPNDNYIQ